ncbi:MAG: hypothetical protein ABGW77_01995 [Campylobacterales bacterium]
MGGLGVRPPFPKRLLARKMQLSPGRIHIVGAPEVGKSCLALHFLKYRYPRRDWLYIDLQNPRYHSNWQEVSNCSLLVLDNWEGVFPRPLPPIPLFLISSPRFPTPPNFKRVQLEGLDWDEFLLFYTHFHHTSPSGEELIQEYLRRGTLPGGVGLDLYHWEKYQRWVLERLPAPLELLQLLIGGLGSRLSIHRIYRELKRQIPISKDTLYRQVDELVEEGVLFTIPKWNSPRSLKKCFFYNPGVGRLFQPVKFPNLLANYLYLHRFKGREVYYREGLTFYLPEEGLGIVVTSFPTLRELQRLLRRLEGMEKLQKVEIWSYSPMVPNLEGGSLEIQLFQFSSLFTG